MFTFLVFPSFSGAKSGFLLALRIQQKDGDPQHLEQFEQLFHAQK